MDKDISWIYTKKNNKMFFLHRLVCKSFSLGSKIDPIYHV